VIGVERVHYVVWRERERENTINIKISIIYSINTVVSCCGDCNVMNYTHSEDVFLNHALKVARHHENTKFIDGDEDRYLDLDL
jgi:hypothetical protein